MRNKALLVIFFLNIVIFSLVTLGVDFLISFIGKEGGMPLNLSNQKIYVFMFFINKWTGLLAILFGINCVKSDEEEGLLGQLISLPILRGEYLIGRIFGASIIVFSFYLLLLLMAGISISIAGDTWPLGAAVFFAAPVKLLYILSIIMISVILSMFGSKLISFIMMMVTFVVIDVSGAMNGGKDWGEMISDLSAFKIFNLVVYSIFPHLGQLDQYTGDLLFKTADVARPGVEIGHAFFALGVLYGILFLIFRKKEL